MSTETIETAEDAAKIAAAYFETAYRDETDPESRYTRTKDDRPDWIQELCHDAHGDMFPDDWKYDCIRAAVDFIAASDEAEPDSLEFADSQVDVYNGARVEWLASSLSRSAYVDDAVENLGVAADADIYDRIGLGQYMEASEVFGSVLQSLETYAEENTTD